MKILLMWWKGFCAAVAMNFILIVSFPFFIFGGRSLPIVEKFLTQQILAYWCVYASVVVANFILGPVILFHLMKKISSSGSNVFIFPVRKTTTKDTATKDTRISQRP